MRNHAQEMRRSAKVLREEGCHEAATGTDEVAQHIETLEDAVTTLVKVARRAAKDNECRCQGTRPEWCFGCLSRAALKLAGRVSE